MISERVCTLREKKSIEKHQHYINTHFLQFFSCYTKCLCMQVYILLQLGLENIWDFSPISDKTLHKDNSNNNNNNNNIKK
jgi:hypothetical protein